MDINDRIRELRSTLNLTQIEFGSKTGISQALMTGIESGKRVVTEKTIKVICAAFNVSETWLRTGAGDVFLFEEVTLLAQLSKQYSLDSFSQKVIETYINLPSDTRNAFKGFLLSLVEEVSSEVAPEVSIGGNLITDPDIASELSSYAKELEFEKKEREKSSASPGGAKAE